MGRLESTLLQQCNYLFLATRSRVTSYAQPRVFRKAKPLLAQLEAFNATPSQQDRVEDVLSRLQSVYPCLPSAHMLKAEDDMREMARSCEVLRLNASSDFLRVSYKDMARVASCLAGMLHAHAIELLAIEERAHGG